MTCLRPDDGFPSGAHATGTLEAMVVGGEQCAACNILGGMWSSMQGVEMRVKCLLAGTALHHQQQYKYDTVSGARGREGYKLQDEM